MLTEYYRVFSISKYLRISLVPPGIQTILAHDFAIQKVVITNPKKVNLPKIHYIYYFERYNLINYYPF